MTTVLERPILDKETRQEVDAALRGNLITPAHTEYEEARSIYNAMIDKRPALIARCENVADVITAVNTARENDLELAIHGGGHNGAGLSLVDNGMVIDLSPMNGVRVDPAAKTAWVEGGATWGQVDHATHAFGLATVSGIISTTGVGGLTLGGGHGYLTRKYGLTVDNLLEAEVVLANGELVAVNAMQHPDLLWALRGGGGNFGVVTAFKFQLHPVDMITGGPTLWPLDQTREVMQWYREFIVNAPEDLYGFFALLSVPPVPDFPEELHGQKVCSVIWCYTGPEAEAEAAFAPVRDVGNLAFDGIQRMPYPALQSFQDPLIPPGLQWYWRGDFMRELSDEAIDRYIEHGRQMPTLLSTTHLYPIDGAAHDVGRNDTAFSYRDANWSMVIAGIDPEPENATRLERWAKDFWQAMHPYSAGGAYVNFMMEEGQERVRATYRDNYQRLVEIKKKYDPENLFHVNQNIKPWS